MGKRRVWSDAHPVEVPLVIIDFVPSLLYGQAGYISLRCVYLPCSPGTPSPRYFMLVMEPGFCFSGFNGAGAALVLGLPHGGEAVDRLEPGK